MAFSEAEIRQLVDNGFVYDGNAYVRHLPCDMSIRVGEPGGYDLEKAMSHIPECPNPHTLG